MSDALKKLTPAKGAKTLLQVLARLLSYCGEARAALSALKLSRKGPDCECIGKSSKGPDCECIGKSTKSPDCECIGKIAKGPDCECIGAKPTALLGKPVAFVQLRADPAAEDQLAKEMTHDLEMNFNKIAPFGKEDTHDLEMNFNKIA